MNINDRKKKYEDFVKWIKEDWKFHIPGTIFNSQLTNAKNSFKSYVLNGAKDEGIFDKELEENNFDKIWKNFVAYSLNSNDKSGFRKWIVENEYVQNVFISYKKNKKFIVTLFVKENVNLSIARNIVDNFKKMFSDFKIDDLKDAGFSNGVCKLLDEARIEETNFENILTIQKYLLSKKDYIEKFEKEKSEFENFSLPNYFLLTSYIEKPNITDNDNTFQISMKNSNNQMIHHKKSDTSKYEIFIAPISILQLVRFVKKVCENHGTIDSLFSLNVRDRKNKNKVTEAIYKSATDYPEDFLMLNNGLTAIVDCIDFTIQNTNTISLTLKNIQIINGQQTTYTLFHHWTYSNGGVAKINIEAAYDKAFIILKAYVVSGSDKDRFKIYNQISNASNSQTAIKSKDLMSTRTFNTTLREKLLNLGINYTFRDGNSDHATQFKNLPKTSLNKLVKMHYMVETNDLGKRGSIGAVFDALTGMTTPQESNNLSKYKKDFDNKDENVLSNELSSIAEIQLFYEAQKSFLGKEIQALDFLIYLGIVMDRNGREALNIDINKFINICSQTAGTTDRNNFYKSSKSLNNLLIKLLEEFNLTNTLQYSHFKQQILIK